MSTNQTQTGLEIAVIGMAGRFPGARDINQFWYNLKNGLESITFYSNEELLDAGVNPELLKNPAYVKGGRGILEDKEYFDASFFGYSAVETELMDPQMRIFHECAWHALENAGYDPFSYDGIIGLYAGASFNLPWEMSSVFSERRNVLGNFATWLLIDRDFLCTRVSYNLNLKGPSVIVKTACSTSLTATHMGCQAILNGECDMALAGGVSITQLEKSGYLYKENMINSLDGHCRAFDAQANGFIEGEGVGIVVLKRLEEAAADRDHIYAVIKGTAANNDGIRKAGYTAPSIDGQSQVISEALQVAEVEPETITYVETHGTGTVVGDPIEIEGLKTAYNTDKKGFCRVGSVKTNIGHLDSAAGVAGLIKTSLALKHKLIPPSLHFKTPNPKIDFQNSPFYVNDKLSEWKRDGHPLRAGVSSFGIGGTNVHTVLEEWLGDHSPNAERNMQSAECETGKPHRLLLLSAKTPSALDKMTENLADYLKNNPAQNIADMAYTLQVGRRAFPHRRMVVCRDVNEAVEVLSSTGNGKMHTGHSTEENKSVIFMFSGLGSQYVNMGLDLYKTEPLFREGMDRCFDILEPLLGYDIKEILYPNAGERRPKAIANDLNCFDTVQAAVFVLEYALSKLLLRLGIKPRAMIGYSFGEYTAACISGVFSLEDALKLIVTRGQLIERLTSGSMLSVPLSIHELKPLMNDKLSIAIDNGPSTILAGPAEAIIAFEEQLKEKKYLCMKVPNSHALHSRMMEPVLKEFEKQVGSVELNRPQIPYISNLTGTWITVQEARDPNYWIRHLKETVRFADGIHELKKDPNALFIEIGPGRDLRALVLREKQDDSQHQVLNLIQPLQQDIPDDHYLLNKIGQLWLHGVNINWKEFYHGDERFRIPLPTYPFDRQRYWIDNNLSAIGERMRSQNTLSIEKAAVPDWFYTPQWVRATLPVGFGELHCQNSWLLFIDDSTSTLGSRLAQRLKKNNHSIVIVKPGTTFWKPGPDEYEINPQSADHYDSMFNELARTGKIPRNIVHLWGLTGNRDPKTPNTPGTILEDLNRTQDMGLYSLLNIARAVGNNGISHDMQLGVITNNLQYVTGEENLQPQKASILGPVKIIPLEYSNIACRSIDIVNPGSNKKKAEFIIDSLLREFLEPFTRYQVIAYRGNCRWRESYELIGLSTDPQKGHRLKEKGVYLVTGGFGGMGFALAEHLAQIVKARLILVDILDYPTKESRDHWLTGSERAEDIRLKKQRIKELEKSGAAIDIHDADISNYDRMKKVIAKSEKRFGKINGVIHTAGIIDYAGIIQNRTREKTEEILAPKVRGTLILDELLKDHKLDFMVFFSSIGNILYRLKFGEVGSSAGHEFLDAFAYYKLNEDTFAVTIDWNYWSGKGMAARAADKKYEDLLSISPSEGITVFDRILNHNLSRVIISPRDLGSMIDYVNSSKKAVETAKIPDSVYDRPDLDTVYVPPSNETEQAIASAWRKLFGIKEIGIEDDFFDLGGDSLMATTMTLQLQREMDVRIPLVEVFNQPTIKKLAKYIRSEEDKNSDNTVEQLVMLKKGPDDAPHFFFIHDGTGEINSYIDLCNHLQDDFNYWGIESGRVDHLSPQNVRFEDVARNYVKTIQSVQPRGPYYLGGWCTGGLLAFEVARQLEQLAQEIKFLAIIDTPPPQHNPDIKEFSFDTEYSLLTTVFPIDGLKEIISDIHDIDQIWSTAVAYLEKTNYDTEVFKKKFPEFLTNGIPNFKRISFRKLLTYINSARTYLLAEEFYLPGEKNNFKTYLFSARESHLRDKDNKLNWGDYSNKPVKTIEVAGNHYSVLKMPNVVEFAKTFEKELLDTLDSQPGEE